MELRVKQIADDDFSRPRLKNIDTGRIYVDVSLGKMEGKYNIHGDWHTASKDGEPDTPLKEDIAFILYQDMKQTKVNDPLSPSYIYPDFIALIHNHSYQPISFNELKEASSILSLSSVVSFGCTILRTKDGKRYTNLAELYDDNKGHA